MMLAKVVVDTCSEVINGSKDDLDAHKTSFAHSSGASEHSGASACGSVQALGTAAPTKTFSDLVALSVIKAHPSSVFEKLVEKEDYKNVRKVLGDSCLRSRICQSKVMSTGSKPGKKHTLIYKGKSSDT